MAMSSEGIMWLDDWTGHDQWNAVYTITIGELIDCGLFDWKWPELDWSSAAFNEDQYDRVCSYFVERFYFREISLEPFWEWAKILKRKLVFELMPKYSPLYELVANDGVQPLSIENEYYKNRTIQSSYPETLLSKNSDYITDGRDEEYQHIKEGPFVDAYVNFAEKYKAVDELLLDDLETMFTCMYTANVNATW